MIISSIDVSSRVVQDCAANVAPFCSVHLFSGLKHHGYQDIGANQKVCNSVIARAKSEAIH
jgi:hypothetical protein